MRGGVLQVSLALCVCPRVFVCLFACFAFLVFNVSKVCRDLRFQHLAILQEAAVPPQASLVKFPCRTAVCDPVHFPQDSLPGSADPCDHPVYGGWIFNVLVCFLFFISYS